MSETIPTRTVDTPSHIQVHAEVCQHRIPRGDLTVVLHREETIESLQDLFDHCVYEGTEQVVMPCLKKLIGRGNPWSPVVIEGHTIRIRQAPRDGGGYGWQSQCSCGWTGTNQLTRGLARCDTDTHVREDIRRA